MTESPKRLIFDEETILKNILILISEASIIFEDDGKGGEDRARYDTWNDKVRCVRRPLFRGPCHEIGVS